MENEALNLGSNTNTIIDGAIETIDSEAEDATTNEEHNTNTILDGETETIDSEAEDATTNEEHNTNTILDGATKSVEAEDTTTNEEHQDSAKLDVSIPPVQSGTVFNYCPSVMCIDIISRRCATADGGTSCIFQQPRHTER